MSLQINSLLSRATLQVDLIRAGEGVGRLACTFTPFKNRQLEGVGYAGEFLLKRGFDVIAFKSSTDDWFQSVLPNELAHVRSAIAQGGYQECVGYGSSMGGFAAIALSGALGLHRVLAFSPQFRIDLDFDTRWASCMAAIPVWRYAIGASTQAAFFLAYDPFSTDALHADLIRNALPQGAVTDIKLPFSGHPSVYFLQETDQLQLVAEAVLAGYPVPPIDRRARFKSVHYCMALAWLALRHHHYSWASQAVAQALRLAPQDAQAHVLKRRIRAKQRRWHLRKPMRKLRSWFERLLD